MFWSKKGPPPPEPAGLPGNARPRSDGRSDAELDLAVETLAEILRARADHAYAVDDEDVTATSNTFERWASHLLVRAAAPVSDELVRTFPRRSDVVARYGGEEFEILLVDTPTSEGKRLAERLLRAVRGLSISAGANAVGVTVSVGLAELMPEESALALVERADRALYAAKQAGRNRLVEADADISGLDKTTNNDLVGIQKAG